MKKILSLIMFFLIFSCNFNKDIYSGKDTKYSNISNEELIILGQKIEEKLKTRYGKLDIIKLKEYEEKKEVFIKHLLKDEEKLEYDNIIIEGLNRIYKKNITYLKKEGILNSEIKKKLENTLYDLKQDIKKLNTIEDYELYFYTNSKLENLTIGN